LLQAPLQRSVRQGEVLKVRLDGKPFEPTHPGERTAEPRRATLAGRSAPFFRQEDGDFLALVPVSVFQKPGSYSLSIEDARQKSHVLDEIRIEDGRYKTQNVTVSATTAGLQPLPGEMEAIQALKNAQSPVRYWDEPFLTPTVDCQNSPFGVKRFHNGKPTGDYHKGVDLRSPQGRPIRATTDGVVRISRMYRLHGGTVGIDHGQGVSSIYIHMSRINARQGDQVRQGDVIGYVGSTGFATGPHLHWGLYVNGLPVNPNPWLSPVPVCR
jgi:murein DD-endopeptidase MepM/ murein hydrolase activator NlpD